MTHASKVLLVVTKSNFGGAQRYCLDLARMFTKRSVDVCVAYGPSTDGNPSALERQLAAEHIRGLPLPSLQRDAHPLRDFAAFNELRALIARERPDVVHLNSSKAGGLGALAARLAGALPDGRRTRIVFTLHGFPGDEARDGLQRALITLATWCTMMLAHLTITVSVRDYERMRRMPLMRRKVVLIRNGIETPTFLSPKDARQEIRALAPNLPEEGAWIGCIAELHANKDHATLIRALGNVPDAHLVLVGAGDMRPKLEVLVQELQLENRIHFLGFIPSAAHYMRAFDCVTLTSRKEGLPYVLLEAGCAYVPVVATKVGGVPDIIVHNFTGLLVAPENPEEIGEAVTRVIRDATLARSLSEELLKRVRGSFSLETMVEKTLATYRVSSSASKTA